MPIMIGPLHPLYDAARKLERAREHIEALDAEIDAFIKSKPFSFEKEINAEGTHQIHRLKVTATPDRRLPLILGDAVHNLRATLDYLICQLVLAKDSKADCSGSQFPILRNETDWKQRYVKRMIDGVDDDPLKIVKGFQPYHYGDTYHEHVFWGLAVLSNRDKHRTLNINRMGFKAHLRPGWEVEMFNEGDVFVTAYTIPLADNPDETFVPTLVGELTFGEGGELVNREPVRIGTPYLWQVYELIRDNVLPRFAGYFTERVQEPTPGVTKVAWEGHATPPDEGAGRSTSVG